MKSQTCKLFTDLRLSAFVVATLCAVAITCPMVLSAQTASTREKHPTIITFDPPGSTVTVPSQVNPAGETVGAYIDASGVFHGFLRAPGAGTGSFQGTLGFSIN